MRVLRRVKRADIQPILRMIKGVFPPELASQAREDMIPYRTDSLKLWCYDTGSAIIAVSGYFIDGDQLWLSWTAVDRFTQGQGIGRAMLTFVLGSIDTGRWHEIRLTTYDHPMLHRAIEFYLHQGFKFYAVVPEYLNNCSSLLYMRKVL